MTTGENCQVNNCLMEDVLLPVLAPMLSRITSIVRKEEKLGNEVIRLDQERKIKFIQSVF